MKKPFATVELKTASGSEPKIMIGNLIPGDSSNQNYLKIEGSKTIYIVSNSLRQVIEGLITVNK